MLRTVWVMANTSALGDLCEAQVLATLVAAGFGVALPWGDHSRYDMVVDCPRGLLRVQVKHARLRDGNLRFATSSVNYDGTYRTYVGSADLFAAWSTDLTALYVVPVEEAPTGNMTLRLRPAASRVRTAHYADRYAWPASARYLVGDGETSAAGDDPELAVLAAAYRAGTATYTQTSELQRRLAARDRSPDQQLAVEAALSVWQVRTLREHHRAGTVAGFGSRRGRLSNETLSAMVSQLEADGASLPETARDWRERDPAHYLIAVAAEAAGRSAAAVQDWLEPRVGWRPVASTVNRHLARLDAPR